MLQLGHWTTKLVMDQTTLEGDHLNDGGGVRSISGVSAPMGFQVVKIQAHHQGTLGDSWMNRGWGLTQEDLYPAENQGQCRLRPSKGESGAGVLCPHPLPLRRMPKESAGRTWNEGKKTPNCKQQLMASRRRSQWM